MTEDHRAKSEKAIAAILAALWERGMQSGVFKFSDTHLNPECEAYYDSCFRWLIDEKLVRVSNMQTFHGGSTMWVMHPVLTAKGYAVLGKDSPEPQLPLGDNLKRILKDAGKTGSKAAIALSVKYIAEHASDYFDRTSG